MRATRVFLAFLVTGSLLGASYWLGSRGEAAPNNDTLSAYFKLDETTAGTAADSSGDANPGTVNGATASADTAPTVFANARSLSFDGNDYVEIADAPELSSADLTISAWVKFNALSGNQTVVAKWDIDHWQEYVIQAQDNELYFYTGNGLSTESAIISSATLEPDIWYHVAGTITGTARAIHVTEAGEATISDTDTAATAMSGSDIELTIGAKRYNAGPYDEYLDGLVDEVRVYSRVLSAPELADLAAGDHTSATWDSLGSIDYDGPGNWDIGAVPDPYTYVTIATGVNQPQASSAIALAGLSIDNGARLNLAGWNLAINDNGAFSNNGTLQLKNSETLVNFVNDSNSGTILLTPDADFTGFKTGNSYHNLIVNDSTFAHWPLDEPSGPVADVSGFDRTAVYQGTPGPSTDVAPVNFANDRALEFSGAGDYVQFDTTAIPANATWCAWAKLDGTADGAILGSVTAGQYALAILGGNQIRAKNHTHGSEAVWNTGALGTSWHHYCVTQTTTITASLELHIDGTPVGGSEVLTNGVGEVDTIGRGGSYYFDGLIDDVRIYNRALSPTEIGRLADGEEPGSFVSTQTLNAALTVNGNLTLASGRLDVSSGGNHGINLAGDLRGDGGILNEHGGTVTLTGTDQSINSSFSFYNLTKQVATAATLTFGQKSTTTVGNMLTLNGAEDELLSLRSSTPEVQWNIDSTGGETIQWLDVKDSNNIDDEPIDITGANVTLTGGNNINWTTNVAPADPINLGPSQFTDGSFTTDTTPTLTFELADTNPLDSLRFRVQIATDDEFEELAVDYTSGLAAQGARSFTPGQGDDEDYLVGEENMLLESGHYYWRVKAIDNYMVPNESEWTVAADEEVAFKVDVTGPYAPGQPETESSNTNKLPTWTWTGSLDNEGGIGLANTIYTLEWSTDPGFGSFSSATTNNLTYTHGTNLTDGQWYFRVRATDLLNNHSEWSVSAPHLIDTTGPNTPVAPNTSTPTSINTPGWGWAIPLDEGIGLHLTQPYILNWSLTSNFSSGVFSTTHHTNTFTHSTPLANGTWYIRVRAVDALGNQSAWSANGMVLIDSSPPSLPGQPITADPNNDNKPLWNWEASIDTGAGLHGTNPYTVQWSEYSNFSQLAGTANSGTNSFPHPTPLADGVWHIRVSARDVLNNQSGYSVRGETTIDTVAPDAPEIPMTASPTNNTTPEWTWAEPDDNDGGVGLHATQPYIVEWSQDEDFDEIEGNANVDATAAFPHTTELTDGIWYFRVRAKDKAGNLSAWSENGEVHVDTQAPTDPGTPETADPVNDNTPTWTWDESEDEEGGSDLHVTEAYIVEWSTDPLFDEESVIFSGHTDEAEFTHTDPLADGTWYIRVRAQDQAGNLSSGWSNPVGSKIVDINPPSDPGTPTTTTPTSNNKPTWQWDESTDDGVGLDPDNPYIVEWSQDSNFLMGFVGSTTIDEAEFTHDDPLADGQWYFQVRAVDAVGNYSGYSIPIGSVLIDATEPSKPGPPSTASPTADDTPTWAWTASSDGAGTGLATNGYIVEWTTDEEFETVEFSSTSTTNSFTHGTSLADGWWYFRVRAVDAVGNESLDSDIGSVRVDDTPPSITGTPPATDTPTNNTMPTWEWTPSTDNGVGLRDPAYDLEWSQDEYFDEESTVFSGQTEDDETEFTHTDPLADGIWYFRVRAVDNLNNTSPWSEPGSVLISTGGPTKPGTPTTGSTSTTNITPTWAWTASSSPADLANPAYLVEWSQDEDFLAGVDSDPINTNFFTHQDELDDGVWYFRVIAEDKTGLFSPYSDVGSVRIDTTGPSDPGTPTTTDPTANTTPTWVWDDSTDDGVDLHDTEPYIVEWSESENFIPVTDNATSDTASFTHTDELSDGVWYFRVRAQDKLANLSDWSEGEVEIDNTKPSNPGSPTTTTPTNDTTPFWVWGPSNDDGGVGLRDPAYDVEWSQNSGFSGAISDTTNTANFLHDTPLTDGTWHFRVRAVDDVGNVSVWVSGQVVVDNSAPTVPGPPTTGGASTKNTTPDWTWAVSTDAGVGFGSPAYLVQWSQNSDLSGASSGNANGASFTHGSDLAEGTWYFQVRAVDAVGNLSGWSGVGSVFVDTDSPEPPGTPGTALSPTSNRVPRWTWTESTDEGYGFGDDPYEVQWSQDSSFLTGVQTGTAAEEEFTHTIPLADGTWHFRVRAVDDAGNESAWSAHGTVIIDGTPPTAPTNLGTTTPTKNTTPTWTWDASTDDGVDLRDPAYEIAWSQNSDFSGGVTNHTTNDPTFTHGTPLNFGTWHFRVRAVDNVENRSAWVSSTISIDNIPPVLSGISSTPGSTVAAISWTTDEPASSQVQYGVGGNFSEATALINTSPRVTSHQVALTGLPACTQIQYRVVSEDSLENVAIGSASSFTTNGCSWNAAIMGQTSTFLPNGSGGSLALGGGSAALALGVPAGFAGADADFQAKQLSPAAGLSFIGQPNGRHLVGNHVYDIKALSSPTAIITNFNGNVTMTISYTAAEAAGFTISSLAIFRHDGTTWQQLSGCAVNAAARSVTCQTGGFSVFGLFGVRATPAPPLPEGAGTVEPDPEPPVTVTPKEQDENPGQTEAVSDQRGLSAAFSGIVRSIVKRPAWWVGGLLLVISGGTLFYLNKRRRTTKHIPYGVHRDE